MVKINLHNIIKKFINFYPFIIFFIIILYVTRKFLFKDGYILYGEFFGSIDYSFFLKDYLTAWGNTNFGHSNIGLTTNYGLDNPFWIIPPGYDIPFLLILSFLQLIFKSFSMKLYILAALILPFIGMYFLARFWFKKLTTSSFVLNSLSYISALIYSISALMGDRISAGHLKYNIGHGLFALLFLFTFKFIEEKNDKTRRFYLGASGLIVGSLVRLMPHLLSLYIIVMGFYFILFVIGNKEKLIRFFFISIFTGLIGILLNIHILLPSLFFKEALAYVIDPTYHSGYVYNLSRSIKLIDLVALASGFEQIFIDKTVYKNLVNLKLILPILAIVGLILNNEKRKSLFIFLVGLIGLILSMGINYPFEKIYNFLFENIFIFKPFREPGKFAILYLFSLSLFIPYVFFYISRFINKKSLFLFILSFTFFILYINPNFSSGNFDGTIIPFKLPKKYYQLRDLLSKSKENFRIAIYPNDKRIGDYDWYPKNSSPSAYYRVFNSLFPLSKNLIVSNRAMWDWSSRYLDYIEINLDQSWAVQRLGQDNVKYLIVDHSVLGYEKILTSLESNPQIKKVPSINGFTMFEINNYSKNIVNKNDAIYYFGDIKGMSYIPNNISLINLGLTDHDLSTESFSLSDGIILFNSSPKDLFYTSLKKFNFSFFPEARFPKDMAKDFFFPAEYLRLSLTSSGTVFYNPEIIQSVGISSIKKDGLFKPGKYKILLNVFTFDNQNNTIKITIDGQSIIKNNYHKAKVMNEWIDFGDVTINNIKTSIKLEKLNNNSLLVDYLLIIPEDTFKKEADAFYSKINSKKILLFNEESNIKNDEVSSFTKPIFVMSKAYSSLWDYCQKKAFRINFYATGFNCSSENSENLTHYKPTIIYTFSLILSSLFYLILILYLVKNCPKQKND